MAIAQTASFLPLLKKKYEGVVRLNVNMNNPLLAVIRSVKDMDFYGEQVVHGIWTGINPSAAPRAELQEIPQPGRNTYANVFIDITSQYVSTKISRQAQFRQKSAGALANLVAKEIEGMTLSHKRSLGRQVWTPSHGGFATIQGGGVTDNGNGTFNIVLSDNRAFLARWIFKGLLLQTGTVSAAGVMTARTGSYEITSFDQATRTVVIARSEVSGTPVAGDMILVNGSANVALNGIEQLVDDSSTVPLHGKTPGDIDSWKATVLRNGGTPRALSVELLKQAETQVDSVSNAEGPDYWVTRPSIGRALYTELAQDFNYTGSPDDLKIGKGVTLPSGAKLVEDLQAPKGKAFGLRKDRLMRYSVQDGGEFLDQAGSNALRLDRLDASEYVWVEDLQIATDDRSAHLRIDDLEDDSDY